jgi:hypothetical protein
MRRSFDRGESGALDIALFVKQPLGFVLNRFRKIGGPDRIAPVKIRDGAGDFQHARDGAGRQAELLDSAIQERATCNVQAAVKPYGGRGEGRIESATTLVLKLSGSRYATDNRLGGFSGAGSQLFEAEVRDQDDQVHAVKQGTRDRPQVPDSLLR